MINWLKRTKSSHLRLVFEEAATDHKGLVYTSAQALQALCPIAATGRKARPDAVISAPDNFGDVVEAIYRVRCNLFHGGKNARDTRDAKLVTVCSCILEKWVGNMQVLDPF